MSQKAFSKIWILVILGTIVAGGILGWRYWLAPSLDEEILRKEPVILEGKIIKEDYVSTVVWVIETEDKERYIPLGEMTNNLLELGEGTEVKVKGYITETKITIPEAGKFHQYPRKAIEIISYEEIIEDETANWKTYRNEKYGFELKYPEDAEVKEHDYSEGKIINFIVDFGKISNNKPVIISAKSQDMEGGMREAIDIQSETEITINRIKGTKISGVDQKGLLVSEIWIKHNNLLYIFKGEGDTFNQILSTFRFIAPELETMEIKVYFIDREMMIEGRAAYKDMVKPVVRTIPKTKTVAKAAIEELLKGPLDEEKSTYISSIPKGVKINSLEIKNGIAYIDFSEELSAYGGGSASALTIGWQIRKTLMQFPTVSDVVISIEGRTEDILQP